MAAAPIFNGFESKINGNSGTFKVTFSWNRPTNVDEKAITGYVAKCVTVNDPSTGADTLLGANANKTVVVVPAGTHYCFVAATTADGLGTWLAYPTYLTSSTKG